MSTRWKQSLILTPFTLVVVAAVWLFVTNSTFLNPTFDAINALPWLASFTGDLVAGLFITILGAFFIPAYLDWRKRPVLFIKNRATRTDVCPLGKASDGRWEGTFQLVVRNEGPTTQREWYWHLLIPTDNMTVSMRGNPAPAGEPMEGSGHTWVHFLGKFGEPIFPYGGFIFPFELSLKTTSTTPATYEAYYYFSTEFGTSPKGARKFADIVAAIGRDADNAFKPEYLSRLVIEAR